MTVSYNEISLGSRSFTQFNYVYPSTDPFGESITLSGRILVPSEIMDGSKPSQGVILFNHYTIFNRDEAPTLGYSPLESIVLGNPLKPDYIIVESDFYGFGATVRFPQAYLQGTVNARASLDGLLAARRLMQEMGLQYGPLTFNMGYSSGGFDALATQKLRDMEYSDEITFDKTFAGGSPSDIDECYRQYVLTDSTAYNAVLALLMVSTNDIQQLGLSYDEVLQPFVATKIDDWINSKSHSSWPVCDSIGREKKVHEILTAPYCDLTSEESLLIQDIFERNSIDTDWIPDQSQRLFIFHSRDDDYVPVKSARALLQHLKNYGMEPSIIPGKTNLQTNFVVKKMGHLTATAVYLVQTLAAIKAWPVMYTDGELNQMYADLISGEPHVVAVLRQLDAMGIDCRAIINTVLQQLGDGDGPVTIEAIIAKLQESGVDTEELAEMCEDSGLDLQKLIADLVEYFNEESNGSDNQLRASRLMKSVNAPLTPADDYEQQLREAFGL